MSVGIRLYPTGGIADPERTVKSLEFGDLGVGCGFLEIGGGNGRTYVEVIYRDVGIPPQSDLALLGKRGRIEQFSPP
jgi:hypothetical protein